jgi:hypothetical protein
LIGLPFLPFMISISAVVFGAEIVILSAVLSTEMGTFLTSSTFSMAKKSSNVGSSFTAASVCALSALSVT